MILVIEGRTTPTHSLQQVDQASYQMRWSGQRSAAFWCAENDPNKLLISHHLPKHQSDQMLKNVNTCTQKLAVMVGRYIRRKLIVSELFDNFTKNKPDLKYSVMIAWHSWL